MAIKVMVVVREATGGMREHVLTLLRGLDATAYQFILVCPEREFWQEAARLPYVSLHILPLAEGLNPIRDLWLLFRLARLLRQDVELLHIHGLRAALWACPAAWLAGGKVRVIWTIHNCLLSRFRGWRRRFVAGVITGLARRVAKVIVVSQAIATDLRSHSRLRPEVVVIPNGIRLEEDERERPGEVSADAPAFLERQEGERLVGCLARLIPAKGVQHLLAAAPLVLARQPQTRFLLIGDGPYRKELERQARELGLTGRVQFLGFQQQARRLLAGLDLFVLPSLSEGLPLSVLEAMAAGLPVVATRVGGCDELVKEGVTGLLVPPADPPALAEAILAVLEDSELATRLGRAARARVEAEFTSARMCTRTEEIYREVLGVRMGE